MSDSNTELGDFQDDAEEETVTDAMAGLLDHYPENEDSVEEPADDRSAATVEERVIEAFHEAIDPELVDAGWGFRQAKSVEFGKTDQSLVNHVRNGVVALARVNEAIEAVGGTRTTRESFGTLSRCSRSTTFTSSMKTATRARIPGLIFPNQKSRSTSGSLACWTGLSR